MRELEFLPPWYPQLRRRRKWLMVQLWATVAIGIGLTTWVAFTNRAVAHRLADSRGIDRLLQQSQYDLKQLDLKLAQKKELETRQQIMSKVGLHVEVSRLLARLDQIMPKEMSLTRASFDTIEQVMDSDNKTNPKGAADKSHTITRKLTVRLQGFTPSDADWATVLAKLGSVPYFQDVQLVNAHDSSQGGHLMREFEVTFAVDLGSGE